MAGLKEAQDQVWAFALAHGLQPAPETRCLDMLSELGELAKELLKSSGYGARPCVATPAAQGELGDCLFSLLCLCGALGVDGGEALDEALGKYARRYCETGQIGSGEEA